jgi:hypothetical protein
MYWFICRRTAKNQNTDISSTVFRIPMALNFIN